ncbi:MAG TPA: hypothetical protein VFN95_09290, partial [Flavitalea sp.]|nr:hypothetical protein [Flavitalea sp.]
EWHELLGSKRGVQVELAVSRILGSRESGVGSRESGVGSVWLSIVFEIKFWYQLSAMIYKQYYVTFQIPL